MIDAIHKGSILTSIDIKSGYFSGNMYCRNLKFFAIENDYFFQLDYSKIANERSKVTGTFEDYERLLKNKWKELKSIEFSDVKYYDRIVKRIKEGDSVGVKVILSKDVQPEFKSTLHYMGHGRIILRFK